MSWPLQHVAKSINRWDDSMNGAVPSIQSRNIPDTSASLQNPSIWPFLRDRWVTVTFPKTPPFIEEFLLDKLARVKWQFTKPLLNVTEGCVHEHSAEFGHKQPLGEVNTSKQRCLFIPSLPSSFYVLCLCYGKCSGLSRRWNIAKVVSLSVLFASTILSCLLACSTFFSH